MRARPGIRRCSKSNCSERAIATLSYNYGEQVATLVPLAQFQEPHTYDLCIEHSQRLTVPRGWQVITQALSEVPSNSDTDFTAIANAVRDVVSDDLEENPTREPNGQELRRRGHLRAL
jgi:hypothetical protein